MKKSEMVDYLTTHINELNYTTTTELVNIVLFLVSQKGMKPPYYTTVVATGKKYNPETDQGRDVISRQDWEPED